MGWTEFRNARWFKIGTNAYFLVFVIFVIWMLFFDTNSLLIHYELHKEVSKLEEQKEYLEKEINTDKEMLKELSTVEALEKYAREKYYMKKENEEVFLIQYEDSLGVGNNLR